MVTIYPKTYDRVFKLLENCAVNGERCPQKEPHGILSTVENIAIADLARAGRIRVEIFAHNWRVVTICEGPHRGKKTAPSPYKGGGIPYKVIEKDDVLPSQRGVPSEPRLLA